MSVESINQKERLTKRQRDAMNYVFSVGARPTAMLLQPGKFTQEQIDKALADYESLFQIPRDEKIADIRRTDKEHFKSEFSKKELDKFLEVYQRLVDKKAPIPKLPYK